MDNDEDDKNQPLYELSRSHRSSIISQLVDIGSARNQQEHVKFLPFIKDLQCLEPKETQLRRVAIDAFQQQQYVALSYTWKPSAFEDPCAGKYRVEGWDNSRHTMSPVRNCVLDRILSYMRHVNVQRLWIDAHCIRQDTCGNHACTTHSSCTQKRNALQAMDLVYQLSKHPVALLARPLQMASELKLLTRILSGKLVYGDQNFQLSRATTLDEAREALWLLGEITQDMWWGRAWTFQENYRGGQQMRLLIRHHESLEQQKSHEMFDSIQGELCVLSVTFCTEATRLCMALRRNKGLTQNDICQIKDVLRAAGRYTAILPESKAMTSTIIADIEARGLSEPWDRLAIVANCCQYPLRLDGEALRLRHHSLSLSLVAMCLLNGEILDNNDTSREPLDALTTSEFLERQLFKAFSAPEDVSRRLTFYKGCRLTSVKLTAAGIVTQGHLWKLGHIVDTRTFCGKLPYINNPNGRLALSDRKRLLLLVFYLTDMGYATLASEIDNYLAADAKATADDRYDSFTEKHLHCMASELAAAIQARQKLRLGSIWDPTGQSSPYRAVFVWSSQNEDEHNVQPLPAFAFTSTWFSDPGSEIYDSNDIDRHVSLEVNLQEATGRSGLHHIHVQRSLLGMCFFNGCKRTKAERDFLRQRLAEQETFFDNLRSLPDTEAFLLLQRLYNTQNPENVIRDVSGAMDGRQRPSDLSTARAISPSTESDFEFELMLKHQFAYTKLQPLSASSIRLSKAGESMLNSLYASHAATTAVPTTADRFVSGHWSIDGPPSQVNGINAFESTKRGFIPLYDSRLLEIPLQHWTQVAITNELAADIISRYLQTDHPLIGAFDEDLIISSMLTRQLAYCSPFLFSCIIYSACQAYSAPDKAKMTAYKAAFFAEAQLHWHQQQGVDSIVNIAALSTLSFACLCHGKPDFGNKLVTEAHEMAQRLNLLVDDFAEHCMHRQNFAQMPSEWTRAASRAVWGLYALSGARRLFYATKPIALPPVLPIPTVRESHDTLPSDNMSIALSQTFASTCELWVICQSAASISFYRHIENPDDRWVAIETKYQELLRWADTLPPNMARTATCPSHVMYFHSFYHCVVLDIFRPYLKGSGESHDNAPNHHLKTFTSPNSSADTVFNASLNQLKRIIFDVSLHWSLECHTILLNAALLQLADACLQSQANRDWQLYFLLCVRCWGDLYEKYPVFDELLSAYLCIALNSRLLTSSEAGSLLTELKAKGQHHAPDKFRGRSCFGLGRSSKGRFVWFGKKV